MKPGPVFIILRQIQDELRWCSGLIDMGTEDNCPAIEIIRDTGSVSYKCIAVFLKESSAVLMLVWPSQKRSEDSSLSASAYCVASERLLRVTRIMKASLPLLRKTPVCLSATGFTPISGAISKIVYVLPILSASRSFLETPSACASAIPFMFPG